MKKFEDCPNPIQTSAYYFQNYFKDNSRTIILKLPDPLPDPQNYLRTTFQGHEEKYSFEKYEF
jgi:hypothetical protein